MKPSSPPSLRLPDSAEWSAFSHDGERLYVTGSHPDIWIWDARTFRLEARLPTGLPSLSRATLHPTAEVIAAGGRDGTVRAWDVATGAEILCSAHHPKPVAGVGYLAGASVLVSSGADGTVRRCDASTGRRVEKLLRLGSHVHGLATEPSGRRCGALHLRGGLVWDWEDTPRERLRFHGTYYHGGEGQSGLAFRRAGEEVWVTFRREPGLRMWRLADVDGVEAPASAALEVGGPVFGLAFSPDERFLALALHAEVVLLRAEPLEILARWPAPNGSERTRGAVHGLSFSRDGRRLATCDVSGGVWVWPLDPG